MLKQSTHLGLLIWASKFHTRYAKLLIILIWLQIILCVQA